MNANEYAKSKGASASKKLLAALAVLAVAFVVLAAVPAVSAGETTDAEEATDLVEAGDNNYATIAAAIEAGESDIKLLGDVTETVTVAEGKDLVLDLNGFKLTNADGESTIVVEKGAKLTVNDSAKTGEVKQDGKNAAALLVKVGGDAILNGGKFTTFDGSSYYVIKNCGNVTVNNGVTVYNSSSFSSSIDNGFYNLADYKKYSGDESATAYPADMKVTMTINGGEFNGICYVKNDDCGYMTINGGTFEISKVRNSAILNWNVMTVGTETAGPTFNGTGSAILNATAMIDEDQGVLTVNKVTLKSDKIALIGVGEDGTDFGTVTVSETFKGTLLRCGAIELKGTINYGESTAVFDKVKTSAMTITTGSIAIDGSFATDATGNITITGEAELVSDLVLPQGMTITIKSGATLTVPAGVEFTNNGTVGGEGTLVVGGSLVAEGTNSTVVSIVDDGSVSGTKASEIDIYYGDDAIKTVIIAGGEIENATYGAAQRVEVTGNTTVTGILTVSGVLHINAGVTLTIAPTGKVVLDGAGTSIIEGALVLEGSEDVTADLEISGHAKLQVKNATLDVAGDLTVKDNASIEFLSGSDATVGGIIAAKSVVIEDSATLTVAGAIKDIDGSKTSFTVAGTLVIESEQASEGFNVELVNGEFLINKLVFGEVVAAGGSVGAPNIDVTVTDGSNTTKIDANAKIDVTASLEEQLSYGAVISGIKITSIVSTVIEGNTTSVTKLMVVSGDIEIAGYVNYEGSEEVPEAVGKLAIDIAQGDEAALGETTVSVNTAITLNGEVDIDGALVLAAGDTNAYAGIKFAAGSAIDINSDINAGAYAIIDADGTVSVNAAITLGQNAQFQLSGTTKVNAAIDATATGSIVIGYAGATIAMASEGSIVAVSEIKIDGASLTSATYSGAFYKTGAASSPVFNYVTIDGALAALAAGETDNVSLFGAQSVLATITLGAGDTIALEAGSALTIGSASNTDVVLTIAKDAKLQGTSDAKITVLGTLYAEKKTDIASALRSNIASDVYAAETNEKGKEIAAGWAKWTNIYTALAEAAAGETVVLQKNIDDLRSVTVPADVTLDLNGHAVTVSQKETLTVVGTLDLTNTASCVNLAPAKTDDKGKVTVTAGAIAIEGYVTYVADVVPVTGGNTIPGAYYTVGATNYLTTYLNGIAKANDAEGDVPGFDGLHCVDFVGKDGKVELGDVAIVGNDGEFVEIHILNAALIAGTVTMTNAAIVLDNADTEAPAYAIKGTFTNGNGTVAIDAKSSAYTIGSDILGDAQAFAFKGSFVDTDADSSISVEGIVYAVDDLDIAVDKLAIVGDLILGVVVDDESIDAIVTVDSATAVTGTVTVREASSLTVEGALTVDGSIMIENGSLDAAAALVNGSIDATATDASATFGVLNVGTDLVLKHSTGADASVTGNIEVTDHLVAAPSAVIPETITGCTGTVFTVNGKDYLKVFATTACPLNIGDVTYTETDAVFNGWYSDGNDVSEDKIGSVSTVSAKLDYNIYTITVLTDGGINYITANGKLLAATSNNNEFSIDKLTAGTYTFEISAKAGYDVSNVQIYNADHEKVTMTVVLGGATELTTYNYSMIGSQAAVTPTPEPTPIIIKDDKDTSLTDTLLIVLVVLIVIMAILVALRMMRS